jgi:hypothetical protein
MNIILNYLDTSKYMKVPHFLRNVFRCLMTTAGITFFLSSGLPYINNFTIKCHIKKTRVVDPDSDTLWIRIRIGNPDPDPGPRK